ncbi:hypothetical protein MJG53_003352 [Ovis ammon polii x Ovis aries]|uniref:Uncharacterized protein n=2 Tax=Ovis TaxID=9935 RepID=A0A836D5G8_SHEEP|nr:hypothetical protein JEQ12_009139 [Ovis aries]KAI4588944.1 hypothetical protein MJG53_003352 [Ovis ammon polii x Ovis aries]
MVPQGEAQTLRWLQGGHPADGEAGEEEAQDAYVLQPEVQPDWRGRDSQRPERPVEKTDNMYTILWQERQYKKLWELWFQPVTQQLPPKPESRTSASALEKS